MIPLIKTDRSLGKSIIQIDTPDDHTPDDPDSVVTLALQENWSRLYVVDDDIGGFLPIYKELNKKKIELCYGLRFTFTDTTENAGDHKLIVFIASEEGYKGLIRLSSYCNVEGGGKLRFDDLHRLWHPDMFLAVPFYDSFLYTNAFTKKIAIPDFRDIKPFVFLEENDLPFDSVLQERALAYAETNGCEVVWTKTIYYNRRSDILAFQIKKLTNRKEYGSNTLEAPNLEWFMSDEFCVESWRESTRPNNPVFEAKFKQLSLFLPGVRLPDFQVSSDDKITYGIDDSDNYDMILRKISRQGLKDKIKAGEIDRAKIQEYADRAKYELDVLEKTKFAPYIALVWDVMNFVNKNGFARNPGRGSAAGSLINYLIGIIEFVDPLKYELYFERFISEGRASFQEIDGKIYLKGGLPDIDCDIGHEDRAKVFEYLQNKYPNRVSKVSTVQTFVTKKLVTEICKIYLNFDKDEAKFVSDMIPSEHGKVFTPRQAYEKEEKFRNFCDAHPNFLKLCLKLHNSISALSKHASAVILAPEPLEYFMPLTLDSDGDIMTSYDQYIVNDMCIKLDLLGQKSSTIIYNACRSLNIKPLEIPFDSEDYIYKPLENLESPWGLFQISGVSAVLGIRRIKPKTLTQISDVISIIRPGASDFIPIYADVNNGKAQPKGLHPLFDDVLEKTNYTILYQEQTMALVNKCGFSLQECDEFRRMIGKKEVAEMAKWKPKFFDRGQKHNIPKDALELLWDVCEKSANYGFNKSHGLVYSVVAAQTVYLKNRYPQHFFLESLKVEQKEVPKEFLKSVSQIITELPRYGIQLLPPSLLKSGVDFTIEGNNIRYGLSAIKGAGGKAAEHIKQFIGKDMANKFDLFNAAKQCKIDARIFSGLSEVGALVDFEPNRHRLVLEYRIWNLLHDKEKKYCFDHGQKYNFDLLALLRDFLKWISIDGKQIGTEKRLETLRKNSAPYIQLFNENSKSKEISQYLFEKQLIGYSFSWRINQLFKEFGCLQTIEDINEVKEGGRVNFVGTLLKVRTGISKKGNKKISLLMQDETGEKMFIMTGQNAVYYLQHNKEPKEGQIIYIQGTKNQEIVFMDDFAVQHLQIFNRVNDLKKLEEKSEKSLDKNDPELYSIGGINTNNDESE